jgi:hypothetical protein
MLAAASLKDLFSPSNRIWIPAKAGASHADSGELHGLQLQVGNSLQNTFSGWIDIVCYSTEPRI